MGQVFSRRKWKYSTSKKIIPTSKKERILNEINELEQLMHEIDESIKDIIILRQLDSLEKQINDINNQRKLMDLPEPAPT